MLPIQFFGQNAHFAISLFAALVFFAVFWLEFDAWLARRTPKALLRSAGFLLIALSFLITATIIEQTTAGQSLVGSVAGTLAMILRILGFAGIIAGQVLDPLQQVPKLSGLDESQFTTKTKNTEAAPPPSKNPAKKPGSQKLSAVGFGSLANASHLLLPLGALTVALLYWRRATTGLERHYKSVALSFAGLFCYESLALAGLWRDSSNPQIAKLVAAFGPLWVAQQALLLISVIILGHWVWQYLTRRFLSQLFMILTSLTLVIFLLTTVSFTYLLVNNVQKASLDNLHTAASVLGYAIDGKKSEILANTQSVAENPGIARAVAARDHSSLVGSTSSFLHDKKQSSLLITNTSGQVLLRAEDPDRYGDSLSSDSLVRRALIGTATSSVSSRQGIVAPLVTIRSAVPIRADGGSIVGAVVTSLVVNNAFVDGIKHATGLDSAVYAGNVRSATTFTAPDGISRWIGVRETNTAVQNTVLRDRQTFKGPISIQNRHFLAVYTPLLDADNSVVGMLFIGQPQSVILQTASHSVELTFLVAALLLVLSILPAYLMSRYISRQLE